MGMTKQQIWDMLDSAVTASWATSMAKQEMAVVLIDYFEPLIQADKQ